ncbi:hypothetical protein [Streptomyces griseofuscus]|uniref:hypothetical protein n=1 Tax=Streptomyces griseofuscus TaxID=146922 RepID=UPI000F652129|nr:hypothetical protein [Streptomyces griseofuscus]
MKYQLGAIFAAASVACMVAAAPAGASDQAPGATILRAVAGGAVCTATPNNPHWSSGASDRRILFKTRVTCTSTYPSVTVRIQGSLQRGPLVGPKFVAATSDQTQVIKNGKSATFYTPQTGGKQVSTPGSYTGFITGHITAPVPGDIGTGHSKTVVLK